MSGMITNPPTGDAWDVLMEITVPDGKVLRMAPFCPIRR
jgi:hypothetical protein